MPRYYFHLTDGKETVKNPEGMDLSGNAAAREEAMVLARDLKHGKVMPGRSWNGWLVSVVDQLGHEVEDVTLAILMYSYVAAVWKAQHPPYPIRALRRP